MRFYWAIVWALTCNFLQANFLQASPISWPTASSRVGQNIYEACDSDIYIAEFLHPEHAYNCISTGARMFSPDPIDVGGSGSSPEAIAMCSDQALLICLCGKGLGHCPSSYRVARYYVCSNPFEYPNSEPVEEAYDGTYATFIASSLPYDCSKPSSDTRTDPSGGDSYGDGGTGTGAGGGGDSGTSDDGGDSGTGDDGSSSSVDPADYDCVVTGNSSVSLSDSYSACYSAKASLPELVIFSSGFSEFWGEGTSGSCYYDANSPDCRVYSLDCSCREHNSSVFLSCYSYNHCNSGSFWFGCYSVQGVFPFGGFFNCSLSIPKPDGSGNWTDSWEVPESEGCQNSCDSHRQKYSTEYPPDENENPGPEDYEDCEASSDCNWVGAPMGYGVCHCSDDTSDTGDEGTGPVSHDGRSSGGDSGSGVSVGVCGKGRDGTSCEDTQQKVLSAVSELGENFENFSKVPTDHGQNDLNSLGSQFETDVNSNEFSDAILNDSAFLEWKEKFLEHVQTIRMEATQLAQLIVVEPPVSNGPYGCLEFDFSGQHFGPECLSEYLQPAIPYLSAFLEFLKYLLGFFILFRGKN